MTKTEKLIVSIIIITIGVLLIALQDVTVQVLTSIAGVLILVFGVLDLLAKETLVGMIKFVFGILVLVFGWLVTSAVLYVLAVAVLVLAAWWIYELWKVRCIRLTSCGIAWRYLQPALLIAIGVLLFFHQGENTKWLFVLTGVLTVMEGALLFGVAIKTIE